MPHKAVFIDRDGTLIDDVGYLTDPSDLTLLPGAELAIKSLRQAGFRIVVVTNQSGVARGLLSETQLEDVHAHLRQQLAEKGAMLDAIYYCPYHPDGTVPKYTRQSDLRKPAPGMLTKAAEELDLDLSGSWMIGDSARDIGAGQQAGCRTILIDRPAETASAPPNPEGEGLWTAEMTAKNLVEAARLIMRAERETDEPPPEPTPPSQLDLRDVLADEPTAETPAQPTGPTADQPPTVDELPAAEEPAGKLDPPTEPSVPSLPDPQAGRATNPDEPLDADSIVRREILQHVRQLTRSSEHEEFSVTNLLGGVTQALAVLFVLLVIYKALGPGDWQQATVWGLVGVIVQTMSLTFFIMSKSGK
jgi:D-glycero-D-manno-heptose 1,7-bisphosphate phosphatase